MKSIKFAIFLLGLWIAVVAFAHAQKSLPVDRPAASPSPALALSIEAAQTALEACKAYKVTVAIVDSAGELKVLLASDGAPPLTAELAWRKARTSAMFKMPSSQTKKDPRLNYSLSSSLYSYYGGGLPLFGHDNELVGALAVSGALNEAGDETCAQAGVEKISSRLRGTAKP